MAAHQAPLSLGFSRQEHWSGLPFPSPMHESEKWKSSRSVVPTLSDHGLQPTRLLHPWDFSRQEYWSGVPLPSPEDELRRHQKDPKNSAIQPRVPCLCSYTLSQDGEWMWCRGSSLRKVTLGGDWGRGTEEVSGQAKWTVLSLLTHQPLCFLNNH